MTTRIGSSREHRSAVRLALPVLAVLLGACYRYAPVTGPTASAGTHVRLALRDSRDPALVRVLGADVAAVEGQVVGTSDTAFTVSVTATLKPGETPAAKRRIVWAGEHVVIPAAAVEGVELRSLDRGRTARVVALGAVGAAVAIRLIMTATGSSGGGPDDGGGVTPP